MDQLKDFFIFQGFVGIVYPNDNTKVFVQTKDGESVGIVSCNTQITSEGMLNAFCNATEDKFFQHVGSITRVAYEEGEEVYLLEFKVIELSDNFCKDMFYIGLEEEYLIKFMKEQLSHVKGFGVYLVSGDNTSLYFTKGEYAMKVSASYIVDEGFGLNHIPPTEDVLNDFKLVLLYQVIDAISSCEGFSTFYADARKRAFILKYKSSIFEMKFEFYNYDSPSVRIK